MGRSFASRAIDLVRRGWGHAVAWGAFYLLIALPAGAGPRYESWATAWRTAVFVVVLAIPPVYVNGFALDRHFFAKRYGRFATLVSATVIGWAALASAVVAPLFGVPETFARALVAIVLVLIPASLVWVLRNAWRTQALLHEARTKQTEAELNALKAQVHPHFLFNTLNNLFVLARRGDPAAADGIAKLSKLLRYVIDERDVDAVPLSLEIEQIQRLIDLEKLRVAADDAVAIDVRVDGNPDAVTVPPMLLVPLVENALKHGVDPTARSFVRAAVRVGPDKLRFTIENSLHARAERAAEGFGLGLQHLRRRLELAYPGAHALTIENDGSVFRVDLRLAGRPTGDRA